MRTLVAIQILQKCQLVHEHYTMYPIPTIQGPTCNHHNQLISSYKLLSPHGMQLVYRTFVKLRVGIGLHFIDKIILDWKFWAYCDLRCAIYLYDTKDRPNLNLPNEYLDQLRINIFPISILWIHYQYVAKRWKTDNLIETPSLNWTQMPNKVIF